MRFASQLFQRSHRAVIAGMLALCVLLLNAMAASPSLHEFVHADAQNSSHQCAVTLFAHGQVDSATVEISAIVPAATIDSVPPFICFAFSPAIENLPAGRAPPVSVGSLA